EHGELQRVHVEAAGAFQVGSADGEEIEPPDGKRQRDVSYVGGKEPLETKGILHSRAAIAVRLVTGRFSRSGSGAQGALIEGIGIGNVEMQGAGHGLELAVSFADFQGVVAGAHREVQHSSVGRAWDIAENLRVRGV